MLRSFLYTLDWALGLPEPSLYFDIGFFTAGDIRTVVYDCIPLAELDRFKTTGQ
jgi:hypothetical protein